MRESRWRTVLKDEVSSARRLRLYSSLRLYTLYTSNCRLTAYVVTALTFTDICDLDAKLRPPSHQDLFGFLVNLIHRDKILEGWDLLVSG